MIRFSEKESKVLVPKLVIKSITGTVKICKTFLNFSDLLIILIDFSVTLCLCFSHIFGLNLLLKAETLDLILEL